MMQDRPRFGQRLLEDRPHGQSEAAAQRRSFPDRLNSGAKSLRALATKTARFTTGLVSYEFSFKNMSFRGGFRPLSV
jgi:hypothetical protein